MAPRRTRRTASRGNTPQSPVRGNTSPQASSPARGSTRRSSRDTLASALSSKQARRILPSVLEEHDDAGEVTRNDVAKFVLQDNEEEIDPHDGAGNDSDHEDGSSDVSLSDGATINTQEDIENRLEALDRDIILDSLPNLYQNSQQVLSLFPSSTSPKLLGEFKTSATTLGKRLRNFAKQFDVSSKACFDGEGHLLPVPLIVMKLCGRQPKQDPKFARPDAVLYLANLANIVISLTRGEDEGILSTLDVLYNNFPGENYLGDLSDEPGQTFLIGTNLFESTANLGVDLRTQFFILQAPLLLKEDEDSFDPDSVLGQIFFTEDDGALRGFESLEDNKMKDWIRSRCDKRIRTIRKYFSKDSKDPIDLQSLKRHYPWDEFLCSLIKWTSERKTELISHISAQGGLDTIVEKLTSFEPDFSNPTAGILEEQVAPVIVEHVSVRTPTQELVSRFFMGQSMSKKIDRLKQLKAQREVEAEESDSQSDLGSVTKKTNPVVQEIPQTPHREGLSIQNKGSKLVSEDEDENQNLAINDDQKQEAIEVEKPRTPRPTQGSIIPTQSTLQVLAAVKRQAVQSNKENIDTGRRFIDRQSNAKRMAWNESQGEGKRRRMELDGEEDDEFETDTRSLKKPRTEQQPRQQGRERSLNDQDDDQDQDEEESVPTSSRDIYRRQDRPPPSTQPRPIGSPPRRRLPAHRLPPSASPRTSPPPPPASQKQEIRQINSEAKARFRNLTCFHSVKGPQQRRAWSEEETLRLIDMVGLYGCKWAEIMDRDAIHVEGPLLQKRGQVGLKDKARNIKMDFLKAGRRLPEGFTAVTMKQGDLDKLDQLGIPHLGGPGGREGALVEETADGQ